MNSQPMLIEAFSFGHWLGNIVLRGGLKFGSLILLSKCVDSRYLDGKLVIDNNAVMSSHSLALTQSTKSTDRRAKLSVKFVGYTIKKIH